MRQPASGRRGFTVALVLLAGGGLVTVVAAGQVWVEARGAAGAQAAVLAPVLTGSWPGSALHPWLAPVGWVLTAAAVGLVAVRGWPRRLLGLLLVLLAIAAAAAVLLGRYSGPDDEICQGVTGQPCGTAGTAVSITHSPWWALALTGLLLAAAGAVVTMLASGRWPSMGTRYERAARSRPATGARGAWDALDRGEDPTWQDDDPRSGPAGS